MKSNFIFSIVFSVIVVVCHFNLVENLCLLNNNRRSDFEGDFRVRRIREHNGNTVYDIEVLLVKDGSYRRDYSKLYTSGVERDNFAYFMKLQLNEVYRVLNPGFVRNHPTDPDALFADYCDLAPCLRNKITCQV